MPTCGLELVVESGYDKSNVRQSGSGSGSALTLGMHDDRGVMGGIVGAGNGRKLGHSGSAGEVGDTLPIEHIARAGLSHFFELPEEFVAQAQSSLAVAVGVAWWWCHEWLSVIGCHVILSGEIA